MQKRTSFVFGDLVLPEFTTLSLYKKAVAHVVTEADFASLSVRMQTFLFPELTLGNQSRLIT